MSQRLLERQNRDLLAGSKLTSREKYRLSDLNTEIGKHRRLCVENCKRQKSPGMQKEAFDKIYKRLMDHKLEVERKIQDQRRMQALQKEKELKEIEEARRKTFSKGSEDYIERFQRDIMERKYKAEK